MNLRTLISNARIAATERRAGDRAGAAREAALPVHVRHRQRRRYRALGFFLLRAAHLADRGKGGIGEGGTHASEANERPALLMKWSRGRWGLYGIVLVFLSRELRRTLMLHTHDSSQQLLSSFDNLDCKSTSYASICYTVHWLFVGTVWVGFADQFVSRVTQLECNDRCLNGSNLQV